MRIVGLSAVIVLAILNGYSLYAMGGERKHFPARIGSCAEFRYRLNLAEKSLNQFDVLLTQTDEKLREQVPEVFQKCYESLLIDNLWEGEFEFTPQDLFKYDQLLERLSSVMKAYHGPEKHEGIEEIFNDIRQNIPDYHDKIKQYSQTQCQADDKESLDSSLYGWSKRSPYILGAAVGMGVCGYILYKIFWAKKSKKSSVTHTV